MQRVVIFEEHDYMNLKPMETCRIFSADDERMVTTDAKTYAKDMNEAGFIGISGTITFKKVLGYWEGLKYLEDEYKKSVDSDDGFAVFINEELIEYTRH